MKILWICEILLPDVARMENKPIINIQGWLSGMAKSFSLDGENSLVIVMPDFWGKSLIVGNTINYKYFCYPQDIHKQQYLNKNLYKYLRQIVVQEKPDVIHIWGTEYPNQSLIFDVLPKNDFSKVVVSIQGLVDVYAKHFYSQVPSYVVHRFGIKELLKRQNMRGQKDEYIKRGVYEKKLISTAKNIIGRTEWDFICVKEINKDVNYYHCNETLREEFYEGQWRYDNCEKYSIFYSSCSYPIKGFHIMIKALAEIVEKYPQSHLYVTGTDLEKCSSIIERVIINDSYRRYVEYLIDKYELREHISFLGNLDARQMKEQYLKCNVFVSASSIENSPNSVGEAMILGTPVVASFVGGMQSIIEHNKNGILFHQEADYMLSGYICGLFEDTERAIMIGNNARITALERHDIHDNQRTLMNIYKNIQENLE